MNIVHYPFNYVVDADNDDDARPPGLTTITFQTAAPNISSLSGYEIRPQPNFPPCPPGTEISTGTECNKAARSLGFPGMPTGCRVNGGFLLTGCANPPSACLHLTPYPQGPPRPDVFWSTTHFYPKYRQYYRSVCRKC